MSQKGKADALLVLATLIWGTTFVLVKEGLRDASPLVFIALRFILAGTVLFAFWHKNPPDRASWRSGTLLGVLLFLGMFFQTWGLKHTTPSKSAFITSFCVILVPIFLTFWGARVRVASWAGAGFGLCGLFFLLSPSRWENINPGDLLTLLAAFAFAFHIILVGIFTRRHAFQRLVPPQILTVGVLAVLALPLDPGRMLRFNWRLSAVIVFTALLGVCFSFSVQNWAQQFTPATHAALIFALEPVFAALTSYVVGAERLTDKVVLGSGLVLAGLLVSELWSGRPPSPIES